MGFRFKKFTLIGKTADLPRGTSYSFVRQKSETLLKKIVQALLDTNTGWVLDSRTPTITSFLEVPDSGSTTGYWPGLLLYNSNSGCKLFAAYISTNSSPFGIKDFSGSDLFTGQENITGLCLSMIPSGSTNSFGQSFDSSFLPSDATRIVGTATTTYNLARNAKEETHYTIGVYATDTVIGVSFDTGDNPNTPKLFVGKIFGKILHENDNLYTSKYGVLRLKIPSTSAGNAATDANYINIAFIGNNRWSSGSTSSGSNYDFYGSINNNMAKDNCLGCFTRSDGTWIDGSDGSAYCAKMIPDNIEQLSPYTNSTINGKGRWVPFLFGCLAIDLDTYGVVPGDGMKGYLDTDLFRCAIGTYGQQFDNGNFICIDGDYNFLIGWDPDNDPLVGE